MQIHSAWDAYIVYSECGVNRVRNSLFLRDFVIIYFLMYLGDMKTIGEDVFLLDKSQLERLK